MEKSGWVVEHLDETVEAEFDALPVDMKAKFLFLASLIEELGLLALREPYVKHLQDKIWELRVKSRSGLGRGLYCTVTEKRVIVLRYFIKDTGKTPKSELELANTRIRKLEDRDV